MNLTTERTDAKNQIVKFLDVYDLFTFVIYMLVTYILKDYVYGSYQGMYMMFSALSCIFFIVRNPKNPKRKGFEYIYFLIKKENTVYSPISPSDDF